MRGRGIAAVVWVLSAVAVHASAQPAASGFQLASSNVVLEPGVPDAKVTLKVRATELSMDGARPTPVMSDVTQSTPIVTVATTLKARSDRAATEVWTFELDIRNFPAADTQSRTFLLEYGDRREFLSYTLTNVAGRTFAWAVRFAPEWNLTSMPAFPVTFHVSDLAATGVQLQQADFVSDDKLKRTMSKAQFDLCANADADAARCAAPQTEMQRREATTLYLRPKAGLAAGTYKGTISFRAAEKADVDGAQVVLYVFHPRGVVYGGLAIAAGVLFALLLQVFLPAWFQRGREQQVVLLLRRNADELEKLFKTLPPRLPTVAIGWTARLGNLRTDISDRSLKAIRTPLVPLPFRDDAEQLVSFKSLVEKASAEVDHLRLLLREGLVKVGDLQDQSPAHAADAETAARTIADIVPGADAQSKIDAALSTLRTAVHGPAPAALARAARTAAEELSSLTFQLASVSAVVWLFWALTSTLTGLYTLVLQNPGFGTPLDFVVCVMWGLGIALIGPQAAQLMPASVATSVGIKLPGTPK